MENANVNAERVQKFNTAVHSVMSQLRRDQVGQDVAVDNVIIAIIAGMAFFSTAVDTFPERKSSN